MNQSSSSTIAARLLLLLALLLALGRELSSLGTGVFFVFFALGSPRLSRESWEATRARFGTGAAPEAAVVVVVSGAFARLERRLPHSSQQLVSPSFLYVHLFRQTNL